jgi:hypothetical protein
MLGADDAAKWVTYEFSTEHPVLRWLPSKPAEWLAGNMWEELVIPEKQGAQYTVPQLNSILANNLERGASEDVHNSTLAMGE